MQLSFPYECAAGSGCEEGGRRGQEARRHTEDPRKLYDRIATLIDTEPTGFRSPTELILFVLRDLTGTDTDDVEQVRGRLRALVYLDEEK